MNHWMHQALQRWATWMQLRMLDKSMGYPKTSPIVNFGMPPSTGAVWDSGNYEADWSDAEELHMTLKKLPSSDFELLVLHYVQCKCVYKRTAHYRGCSDKTAKAKVQMIMAQVDRLMADDRVAREKKSEPVRELNAMEVIE